MNINTAIPSEITRFIHTHPNWSEVDNALTRDFEFANFSEAFGFMKRVAILAETLNHHPEWSNVYARVSMRITTHEKGGITTKDFEFIEEVDAIYNKLH